MLKTTEEMEGEGKNTNNVDATMLRVNFPQFHSCLDLTWSTFSPIMYLQSLKAGQNYSKHLIQPSIVTKIDSIPPFCHQSILKLPVLIYLSFFSNFFLCMLYLPVDSEKEKYIYNNMVCISQSFLFTYVELSKSWMF